MFYINLKICFIYRNIKFIIYKIMLTKLIHKSSNNCKVVIIPEIGFTYMLRDTASPDQVCLSYHFPKHSPVCHGHNEG